MRDEQRGEAEIALELLQQIHDLGAHADVESGHRFIGDDELRTQSQSAGDTNALALATGELVRKTGQGGFIHSHCMQKFPHPLAAGIAAQTFTNDFLMENQRLGNHVFHTVARVERSKRVLEDDLYVAAKTAQFLTVRLQPIAAIEKNGT